MQVETYECSETVAESNQPEVAEEAIGLIESLGLAGQQSLITKGDDDKPAVRFPYRKMTAEEGLVYRTLCDKTTDLHKYADSPIPLRVLQVAAHAKSLNFFEKFVVLHPSSADIKDPVLVGIATTKPTSENEWTREEHYILARWGEHLDELPALCKQAARRLAGKFRDAANKLAAQAKSELVALENELSLSAFMGKSPLSTSYGQGVS